MPLAFFPLGLVERKPSLRSHLAPWELPHRGLAPRRRVANKPCPKPALSAKPCPRKRTGPFVRQRSRWQEASSPLGQQTFSASVCTGPTSLGGVSGGPPATAARPSSRLTGLDVLARSAEIRAATRQVPVSELHIPREGIGAPKARPCGAQDAQEQPKADTEPSSRPRAAFMKAELPAAPSPHCGAWAPSPLFPPAAQGPPHPHPSPGCPDTPARGLGASPGGAPLPPGRGEDPGGTRPEEDGSGCHPVPHQQTHSPSWADG